MYFMRKIKGLAFFVVLMLFILVYIPYGESRCIQLFYEVTNLRVNNETQYIITSALAVGDMNGDNRPDIAVSYYNYLVGANYTLSLYEINGKKLSLLATLDNFAVTYPDLAFDLKNTYMYDINGDGKDELFIDGKYNGNEGVFVITYVDHSLKILNYFKGTDSAILNIGGSLYLVVNDNGIYSIKNGRFTYIPNTFFTYDGYVRTGHFSKDANIALMDGEYLHFYSFKNKTLREVNNLKIKIPVDYWGNDVGYWLQSFTITKIGGEYDAIFFVSYHNGYTLVHYEDDKFQQVSTGLLDAKGGSAMCAASSRVLSGVKTDFIVVGFGNYIFSPLFKIYEYKNGNLTELYTQYADRGNTKNIVSYDINGDGTDDIVLGSQSSGYLRVFLSMCPYDSNNSNSTLIFFALGSLLIIAIAEAVFIIALYAKYVRHNER